MLTDRDERALIAAAENRIAEPLRAGAALAAVRGLLRGLRRGERESVTCHPTATPDSNGNSGTSRNSAEQRTAPLPR
ncbi:hypothetical protein J7F03_26905 [Streptomyces sp. ISL-43]|uniref:hypothetical protein n=1 Tax=Streptomyces sp. ISL-43 TaxID=2819183 RepID=UPI001BEC9224|nr:hypothetical protein [Streptomyces sp. ISL-43]MBT2450638.1 hypothetical protein [Streptomyces sp. ISL-43]